MYRVTIELKLYNAPLHLHQCQEELSLLLCREGIEVLLEIGWDTRIPTLVMIAVLKVIMVDQHHLKKNSNNNNNRITTITVTTTNCPYVATLPRCSQIPASAGKGVVKLWLQRNVN